MSEVRIAIITEKSRHDLLWFSKRSKILVKYSTSLKRRKYLSQYDAIRLKSDCTAEKTSTI